MEQRQSKWKLTSMCVCIYIYRDALREWGTGEQASGEEEQEEQAAEVGHASTINQAE